MRLRRLMFKYYGIVTKSMCEGCDVCSTRNLDGFLTSRTLFGSARGKQLMVVLHGAKGNCCIRSTKFIVCDYTQLLLTLFLTIFSTHRGFLRRRSRCFWVLLTAFPVFTEVYVSSSLSWKSHQPSRVFPSEGLVDASKFCLKRDKSGRHAYCPLMAG